MRAGDLVLLSGRELLVFGSALTIAVSTALWLLFAYLEPPPPKRLRITAGTESGAYFDFGRRYAEQFRKNGIALEVLRSEGSVENLTRLADANAGVSIGFVQSGVGAAERAPGLESLASIAYEPLWIFYKPKAPSDRWTTVQPLRGNRVAIGPEGSGTRLAALNLLAANGIGPADATFSDLTGSDAVQALLARELDAVVIVAAPDAPSVRQALAAGLEPVSFSRADAYVRIMPWLSKVTLPRGVVDLARDLPREDVVLVAASANLVVRKDLHPAVAYLLMDVASEAHRAPTITSAGGEFPSEKSLEYPQSAESKRFFRSGRPFLQRYLPFWIANLIERLVVTLLPALAIIVPLVRFLPALIDWRERAAILRLYDELRRLDLRGELDAANRSRAVDHLARIESSLGRMRLGARHHVDVYNLKIHLDMLRARLASTNESRASLAAAARRAAPA